MTLSEQTNATILNTLNGVRHNPSLLLLPYLPGSHLSFHLIVFQFYLCPCFGPPSPLGWALFAPVGTY